MKISLRKGTAAISAILCTIALAACSGGDDKSDVGDEVRILVSVPLSGDSAETGQDMLNGAKLAAKYINDKGGIQSGERKGQKVSIEGADDQLDTQAATTIASRFVSDEKYYALTGYLTSGQAQAAGVVLDKHGLGLVSSFSGADFLIDEADNIVVALAPVAGIPAAMADFAANELNLKTASAISGDFSFLDSYHEGLARGAKASGLNVLAQETYADGTSDFATLLTRLNRDNPEAILSGAFQADAGKIAAQMRKSGMNQPFLDYLGEGWGAAFFEAAGSAIESGEFYSSSGEPPANPEDANPEEDSIANWVTDSYQSEYGKVPPAAALYTFESVLTIVATIEAGASDRKDFIEYVSKVSGEGFFGPIAYTKDLQPVSRPLTISRVTGSGPEDKEVKANYLVMADGSVERQ